MNRNPTTPGAAGLEARTPPLMPARGSSEPPRQTAKPGPDAEPALALLCKVCRLARGLCSAAESPSGSQQSASSSRQLISPLKEGRLCSRGLAGS